MIVKKYNNQKDFKVSLSTFNLSSKQNCSGIRRINMIVSIINSIYLPLYKERIYIFLVHLWFQKGINSLPKI